MALALTVAVLVGGGVFMILRRGMMRIVVGFVLLSHGVNLLLVTAGGPTRRDPALGSQLDPATTADPLPQAFVLTAVVIAFAVTIFMLVLAVIGSGDDDTEFDIAGRELETPDFIEPEAFHRRHHAMQNWHDYLDPSDDLPDPVPAHAPAQVATTGSDQAGHLPGHHATGPGSAGPGSAGQSPTGRRSPAQDDPEGTQR